MKVLFVQHFVTPLLCFVFLTSTAKFIYSATTIKTKLIHRDSIPYQSRIRKYFPKDDVRANLIPNDRDSLLFANLSIGEPPTPQLLVLDTGSILTWAHCIPCIGCDSVTSPIFDPAESSTYDVLSCYSDYCDARIHGSCDSLKQCNYYMGYADNSESMGELATEKFTFVTSTDGLVEVPNVVFGCGREFSGKNEVGGILGLGSANVSLVSKLSFKFSYCIGDIGDPNYRFHHLILGEEAKMEGDATPLEIYQDRYYVTLETIRIREKLLEIDPEIFKLKGPRGAVAIDSGSTAMILPRSVFEALKAEVQRLIGELLPEISSSQDLCYWGRLYQDLQGFPMVTLALANGVELELDIGSMFIKYKDIIFCMAVRISEETGQGTRSIIRLRAQQHYNVGFDILEKKAYFQRTDCELIEY
ncbi:unnamed protein product [Ilex paraguariensis]|uniref:Peptidase A1 domain-containing protein n=1 Tax=Ilex paraguariensis TaxID=185542 RepID=A0ABC8UUA1_9AQUA